MVAENNQQLQVDLVNMIQGMQWYIMLQADTITRMIFEGGRIGYQVSGWKTQFIVYDGKNLMDIICGDCLIKRILPSLRGGAKIPL